MSRSAMLLTATLVFSVVCCCGGIFSAGELPDLVERNVGGIFEENISEVEEIQKEVETQVAIAESEQSEAAESGPAADETREAVAGEAEADVPAVELPEEPLIEGEESELIEGLMDSIQEQIEESGDELLNLSCDDLPIPMPVDAAECVNVAGITTYSTSMNEADINQMYDDYFTGEGWEPFSQVIQGDVTNAWTREAAQSYAMLTFLVGEGESGTNLVSIAVIGNE